LRLGYNLIKSDSLHPSSREKGSEYTLQLFGLAFSKLNF
jgi:hypothetical protein